jgi:hypothetical protein
MGGREPSHPAARNGGANHSMTDSSSPIDPQLIEAHEASHICAINGIVSLANILRKRNILSDAEASALYESMSLPLGMAKYAANPSVQEIQLNLDRLFAMVVDPG